VCAGSGGGVDQADARHGGLDRPRMEWAVALPGGPPPPTPRRGRGPRGPIVIRRNAQPGGLGPVDRRSCRAGGTGRGRGQGAGGILSRGKRRPARPAQGGPRRGRGPCGAGGLGLLPRKERAEGHGSGGPSQGRCKGAAPARESKSGVRFRGAGSTAARGGNGRGRCGLNQRGQRARTEERASR